MGGRHRPPGQPLPTAAAAPALAIKASLAWAASRSRRKALPQQEVTADEILSGKWRRVTALRWEDGIVGVRDGNLAAGTDKLFAMRQPFKAFVAAGFVVCPPPAASGGTTLTRRRMPAAICSTAFTERPGTWTRHSHFPRTRSPSPPRSTNRHCNTLPQTRPHPDSGDRRGGASPFFDAKGRNLLPATAPAEAMAESVSIAPGPRIRYQPIRPSPRMRRASRCLPGCGGRRRKAGHRRFSLGNAGTDG